MYIQDGYCTDTKDCVARNLYSLLQQFYQVFPEQIQSQLFITGESYGGHYVPAIGAYIHEQNTVRCCDCIATPSAATYPAERGCVAYPAERGCVPYPAERGCVAYPAERGCVLQKMEKPLIPLAGIAVGDGWVDPVNMIPAYPNMVFNMGMADDSEKGAVHARSHPK